MVKEGYNYEVCGIIVCLACKYYIIILVLTLGEMRQILHDNWLPKE